VTWKPPRPCPSRSIGGGCGTGIVFYSASVQKLPGVRCVPPTATNAPQFIEGDGRPDKKIAPCVVFTARIHP
jgi:hypothetical protein